MDQLRRLVRRALSRRSHAVELTGLGLVAVGVGELYLPAGLVFIGCALVFIAQGMERDE